MKEDQLELFSLKKREEPQPRSNKVPFFRVAKVIACGQCTSADSFRAVLSHTQPQITRQNIYKVLELIAYRPPSSPYQQHLAWEGMSMMDESELPPEVLFQMLVDIAEAGVGFRVEKQGRNESY